MKPRRRRVDPFDLTIDSHIRLSLMTPDDAPQFLAFVERNRESLEEWLGWAAQVRDLDGALAFIERYYKRWEHHASLLTHVWVDGALAGMAVYRVIDHDNHYAEIGYAVDAAFRGRGLATTVTRALMDYAYDVLDMNRIIITCATGNVASRAIPERLGFRREGTSVEARVVHGQYIDLAHYAMLRREWAARCAAEALNGVPGSAR